MAYRIQKQERIKDTLELEGRDGEVICSLEVDLMPQAIITKLNDKIISLTHAQSDLLQASEKLKKGDETSTAMALKAYGDALTDVLEVVFGVEGAQTLQDIYQHDMILLGNDIMPYLNKIIPEIRKSVSDIKAATLRGYNRKQSRGMFFRK